MTWVEFGNDAAQEGYRDPASDDPDLVRYRDLDGERVTTFVFPDDLPLSECFTTATAGARFHFQAADTPHGHALPKWVESDSPGLKALLSEHFGLTGQRQQRRPKTWGKEFGIPDDANLHSARLYAAQGGHADDETTEDTK